MNIASEKQKVIFITFLVYLTVTLLFGVIAKRRKAARGSDFAESFFTGNKAMGGIVMGLMIMATMLSSGTFIGSVGAGYFYGFTYIIADASAYGLFFILLCSLGKRLNIVARRINGSSVVQLIKSRYANNNVLAIGVAVSCVIFLSFYCASQLVGGAKMFATMTGQNYIIGLVLFGVVVMIYTLVGGISSVASAAVFQGFVMLVAATGLFVSMQLRAGEMGGLASMYQTLVGTENENLLQVCGTLDGKYMISLAILGALCGFGMPHAIQGAISYKDTKAMKTAIVVSLAVSCVIYIMMNINAGVMAHVLNPDLTASDAAMPYLAATVMPAWLAGILLSGAVAAIQSTLAGMLLVICSTIAKDIYRDIFNPGVSDKKLQKVTYVVIVLVIAMVIILSINPPDLMQKIVYLAMGGLGATLGVPVFFGAYWKRANEYGAIAAVFGALLTYIAAVYILPQIAGGMEPFVVSVVVGIALMIVVSLMTKPSPKGTIQVWFGEKYDKKFALRTDPIR